MKNICEARVASSVTRGSNISEASHVMGWQVVKQGGH